MNKKGISLQQTAITIVVASMFFVGFWGLFAEMGVNYNLDVDENFSNSFDKIEETKDIAEDLTKNVEGSQATSDSGVLSFLNSGISSLKIVIKVIDVAQAAITDMADFLGIPSYIFNTFLAVFLLAISFAVVAALVGRSIT